MKRYLVFEYSIAAALATVVLTIAAVGVQMPPSIASFVSFPAGTILAAVLLSRNFKKRRVGPFYRNIGIHPAKQFARLTLWVQIPFWLIVVAIVVAR